MNRCFVLAEAGLNHNGDPARALEMVRVAAEAGCLGFKIQAYTAAEFVGPSETYTYLEREGAAYRRVTEKQRDMFNRCALSFDAVRAIHAECARLKISFAATATDAEWIERIKTLDPMPSLKIGSDDIVHLPLLRLAAASGLPVILSTGMASEEEIAEAVAIVKPVALLHCVSLYPTPGEKANLTRMVQLAKFGAAVGFSDHTVGSLAGMMAASMGASLIEKHFTLDKALPGPDHWFSANPEDLRQLVTSVRVAIRMRGTGEISPGPEEVMMRAIARRSVVAACNIPLGATLTQAMVAYRRPGTGLKPGRETELLGQMATRVIREGELLAPEAFILSAGGVVH